MKISHIVFSALAFVTLTATAQITQPPGTQTPPPSGGAITLNNLRSGPLTLNDAIATSLQNNYDIQLVQNSGLVAALDAGYSRYALLPRVSANGGWVKNNNDQKQILADGTKRERSDIQSNNLSASVNLDWTLFDGFRMFIARRRLNELMELSELQLQAQVATSVADVMTIYYNIVRQQQQIKALQEQMSLSEERLKLAQYKFEIGTGVKPDVLQAQIDLNAQKSAYLVAETAIAKLKEQLNQLLVLPLENQFSIADTAITFNNNLLLDSVRQSVTATNPELLIAERNLLIADLNLKERKAERYPVLEFNSAYNFNRTNNKAVINPFQSLFNQNAGFSYGFTASVPLFNGLGTRKLIKAAELDVKYQKLAYDQSLALVNTSILNAYKDYDLYKRTLALEEENMKLVRENIFIARERYRLGVSTFIELREAEQSLAASTTRLIEAQYNAKVAEIELLRLRGDIIK